MSLSIHEKFAIAETVLPDDPSVLRKYTWKPSGMTQGLTDFPNMDQTIARAAGGYFRTPFALSEIDLSVISDLEAKARKALNEPSIALSQIRAERPRSLDGMAAVEWRITFAKGGMKYPEARFDLQGNLLKASPQ